MGHITQTEQSSSERPKKERITVEEACAILGVSARTIHRLTNSGKLPTAAKIGRIWTYNEKALRDWLRDQEEEQAHRVAKIPNRMRPAPTTQSTSGRQRLQEGRNDISASRKAIGDLRQLAKQKAADDRRRNI